MPTLATAKRYRLAVPAEDESVHKWIESQLNMSVSLRQLIREDIRNHGYSDVTCRSVELGNRRVRSVQAVEANVSNEIESEVQILPVTKSKRTVKAVVPKIIEPEIAKPTKPEPVVSVAMTEPSVSMDIGKLQGEPDAEDSDNYKSALESLMM